MLASANLHQEREPKAVIEDYFATAGLSDTLDPLEASSFTVKTDQRMVSGTAGTEVPTSFLRLMGFDTLPALADAAAEESMAEVAPENREVSIVIDISGSMRNNGRIDELRRATKDLVTILLTGDAGETTSINLVPYAGHVNPGPEMFEILGSVEYGTTGGHMHPALDTFPELTKDISNVVFYYDRGTAGTSGYDFTARIEGYPGGDVALFNKDDLDEYVWFADAYFKRHAPGLGKSDKLVGVSWKAGPKTEVRYLGATFDPIEPAKGKDKGTVDFEAQFNSFYAEVIAQFSSCIDYGPSDFQHTGLPNETWYAQVPHFMYWPIDWQTMDWGWCPEDDSAIRYASNDEAALHAFIDGIRLHDGSGAHHGLKWGLALLDPSSNDEFLTLSQQGLVPAGFADRPARWTDDTTTRRRNTSCGCPRAWWPPNGGRKIPSTPTTQRPRFGSSRARPRRSIPAAPRTRTASSRCATPRRTRTWRSSPSRSRLAIRAGSSCSTARPRLPLLRRRRRGPVQRLRQCRRSADPAAADEMIAAARRYARRRAGNESGTSTVEFVLLLPAFVMLMLMSAELGYVTLRQTMLERGLDIAMRQVRLDTGTPPQHDQLKQIVCDAALILPDCANSLKIEMVRADLRNFVNISDTPDCVDLSEPVSPVRNFQHGQPNELMIVRACSIYQPSYPRAVLGAMIVKKYDGQPAFIATSAFVQEPA